MGGVWIVGATGRTGRALARRLAGEQEIVLVGRDADRLQALAAALPGRPRTLGIGSVEAVPEAVGRGDAAVVVNLVGPYPVTGPRVAGACPPGTHYVDLANELDGVRALLAQHDAAVAGGRTVVTGAGFGVTGTESVVRALCAGRPAPAELRVDALPAVRNEAGRVGEALAGSVLESLARGGWRYEGGRLVSAPLGGDVEVLTLPDGSSARTAALPTGELEAAYRASGAPRVVAASTLAPTGPLARVVLPGVAAASRVGPLRRALTAAVARVPVAERAPARAESFARARVRDADGTVRVAWMRAGEAMDVTVGVAAEVVRRLAAGSGEPGAWTPGALFGPELVTAAGGRVELDEIV